MSKKKKKRTDVPSGILKATILRRAGSGIHATPENKDGKRRAAKRARRDKGKGQDGW